MICDEFLQSNAKTIPPGCRGKADEQGDVTRVPASSATSHVTGAAINMDGGLSPVA